MSAAITIWILQVSRKTWVHQPFSHHMWQIPPPVNNIISFCQLFSFVIFCFFIPQLIIICKEHDQRNLLAQSLVLQKIPKEQCLRPTSALVSSCIFQSSRFISKEKLLKGLDDVNLLWLGFEDIRIIVNIHKYSRCFYSNFATGVQVHTLADFEVIQITWWKQFKFKYAISFTVKYWNKSWVKQLMLQICQYDCNVFQNFNMFFKIWWETAWILTKFDRSHRHQVQSCWQCCWSSHVVKPHADPGHGFILGMWTWTNVDTCWAPHILAARPL